MRIAIGSDHGAFELKEAIIKHLEQKKISVLNCGTDSTESVDYPDIADKVVKKLQLNEVSVGILCCGTGIGISMKANRNKGIRAALVHDEFTAKMSKAHNNANIICLGGRTTSIEKAIHLINIWLETPFESGRHQKRIDKLDY